MIKNRDEIIALFEDSDIPTGADFKDFIDSIVFQGESSNGGFYNRASESEALIGIDNGKTMTPLRVAQSIVNKVRLPKLPFLREDILNLLATYGTSGGGTPPPATLPVCDRELTLLSIVLQSGNDWKINFDSAGVSTINWDVKNSAGTTVLSGTSGQLTTNNFIARLLLPAGTYSFIGSPSNCSSPDLSKRTISFTIANAVTIFSITDITIERFVAKLKATVLVSNTNNIVIEYSKDNAVWQSSNVFDNLTETNKFYVREVAAPLNKVEFTKQDSLTNIWLQNEIKDFPVIPPAMLNQIDLSFIEDFNMPLKPNGKPVIESFLIGAIYRQQSTVGDVYKKGYTHVSLNALINPTEKKDYPYPPGFVGPIPAERTININYGHDYSQLKLNIEATEFEMNAIDFNAYNDIKNNYLVNIPQVVKTADTTYKGRWLTIDIENRMFYLPMQDFVNRNYAIHKALLDGSSPDSQAGLMYQSAPIIIGSGITRAHYNSTADAHWTLPCAMNSNAQQYNMPVSYVGQSLRNLPRLRCICEYYLYYEAFQPEGTRLLNVQNTNLRDWAGADISVLTHFNIGLPSYLHWASHTMSLLGIQRPHLNGHTLHLQFNIFNLAGGDGCYYRNYTDSNNQPQNTILKQTQDGLGRYPVPNFIVMGKVFIATFSGAFAGMWESPVIVLTPEPRTTPEFQQVYRDYTGVGAQSIAYKRIVATKARVGNQIFSLVDLLDGNEIYSCEKVEVDYLNVPNYQGKREVNPLDLIEFKLSPVMTIVNEAKGLIAIWACQAYGVEQSQVDVYYTKNCFNFKKRIQIPANFNKVFIYSLSDI
jgi:hypothetical protein